jgi:hypothetical protein
VTQTAAKSCALSWSVLLLAGVLAAGAGGPARAASSFQNSCSQIAFAYVGNQPAVTAICRTMAGTVRRSWLVLSGISNQNGNLAYTGGPSSFQLTCRNMRIVVNSRTTVTLTAVCRTVSGAWIATGIGLDNIANIDGNLRQ